MRVIPAIDLIDGSPVRLSEGDYSRKTSYGLDALDTARAFEDGGLEYLHLVDLDAAAGRGNNLRVLETIASRTGLIVDFGGGVRTKSALLEAFNAGADKVNIGSKAAKDPEEVISWGREWPGRIILSSDVRGESVAVSGWMETTDISIIPFVSRFAEEGIRDVVVTDIAHDGMLSGPSFALYEKLLASVADLNLIASGGVSSMDDLKALYDMGADGVIVGKAYYEGRITIAEMKEASCWRKE